MAQRAILLTLFSVWAGPVLAETGGARPLPFGGTMSAMVWECRNETLCGLRCSVEPGSPDAALEYGEERGVRKIFMAEYRIRPGQPPMRCIQVWFKTGEDALHAHLPASLVCSFGAGLELQADSPAGAAPHVIAK